MRLARHPKAPWYLFILSFAESSFFPIPPDVMLIPMALGNPKKWWRLAAITTAASVLGGVAGYLIGVLAFELVEPLLHQMNYWDKYLHVKEIMTEFGVLFVFVAAFTPVPYKLITIASGVLSLNPFLFIVASIIGRGARFFMVAGLMAWGGERMEAKIKQYVEWIGWAVIVLSVIVVVIWYMRH